MEGANEEENADPREETKKQPMSRFPAFLYTAQPLLASKLLTLLAELSKETEPDEPREYADPLASLIHQQEYLVYDMRKQELITVQTLLPKESAASSSTVQQEIVQTDCVHQETQTQEEDNCAPPLQMSSPPLAAAADQNTNIQEEINS